MTIALVSGFLLVLALVLLVVVAVVQAVAVAIAAATQALGVVVAAVREAAAGASTYAPPPSRSRECNKPCAVCADTRLAIYTA